MLLGKRTFFHVALKYNFGQPKGKNSHSPHWPWNLQTIWNNLALQKKQLLRENESDYAVKFED